MNGLGGSSQLQMTSRLPVADAPMPRPLEITTTDSGAVWRSPMARGDLFSAMRNAPPMFMEDRPMANQLLTAAMVHVFALAGFAAGIATLWAISRACRAARNGLRWCWRRGAHG